MFCANRSLNLGYVLASIAVLIVAAGSTLVDGEVLEGAVSESKLGAGPQNVNRVLPEFQCELEAVKAGCDSTTRGREIRRMKRTYRKCISDYKLQLASEQQKLRESLSSIVMPDVRKVVIAKIDLTGKVIATEYKLPKIVGTGGNSIDVRDFYDLAHGQ